ncbi:MAG: hypothetical protein KGH88_06620 [Thaumarchaeota archaeon]|nr:hypothetical protein [Nitrososphaerota archaeon]
MRAIRLLALAATISGFFAISHSVLAEDAVSFAKIDVAYNQNTNVLEITGIVYKTFSQDYALTIFNPQGHLIFVSQPHLSQNDTFSQSIVAAGPLWSEPGNYTVKLTSSSQVLADNSFYFRGMSCCVQNSQGIQAGPSETANVIGSPLKQFKSGVMPKDVKCKSDLQLIIKTEDGTPACVRSYTAQKLIERGWATMTGDFNKSWIEIDTQGLNNTYIVNKPISFSVIVKGFGSYPCVSPQIKIHDVKTPSIPVFEDSGSTMSCPSLSTPGNYSFDFPGSNSQYVIILNKTGDYAMTVSYGSSSVQKYFSVVLPSNPKSITVLENNAGTVLLQNQTYYFETPNYTSDAYTNPTQISFHDVTFTLFPAGFSGGLPVIHCGLQGSGLGQYYWADAKFSDNTHELLHLFAYSPSVCNLPVPSMFSTHTNPQAGLAFYDGKMKLLVSEDKNDSRITQMSLKAYAFPCCGMKGDLLKGSLSSSAGPIPDANVTISVNDILMGYTKTLPDGCFQFNRWNESNLSNQTSAYLARERASGSFSPFPLTFFALYHGDNDTYFPASANATSYESLTAIPFPPPQLESTVTPSQVNVTQGSSAHIQISVRPMIESWNVAHMNLYLDRLPCGTSYEISQASDNDTSSVTHPAVFDVTLRAAPYSPEGTYFVGMDQNGTNSMVSRDAAGTFGLNVLKMK